MALYQRLRTHQLLVSLTNLVFGIFMSLLVLRFVFRLFAANNDAPFIEWLYSTTDVIISPFRGIFTSPVIDGQFIFDVTTLVAIILYALLFSFIVYLFDLIFGVNRTA